MKKQSLKVLKSHPQIERPRRINSQITLARHTAGLALALAGLLGAATLAFQPATVASAQAGTWTLTGNPNTGLYQHTATLLQNATPSDRLEVVGDIRVGTSGSNGCLKNFSGGAITGTCSSDRRLKHSITAFPATLDKLVRLRPVHFYWRWEEYPDRRLGRKRSFGLIAQEVEEVLPELVAEDENGFKAVDYSKLPLLTVQAIKELKAQIDEINTENQALKSRLQQQQAQIEALKRLVCASHPGDELCR